MEDTSATRALDARFFTLNRTDLYRSLEEDAVLVVFAGRAPRRSADTMYPFFADRNFFFLTGFEEPEAVLVAAKSPGQVEERLYVLPKDELRERWTGKRSTAEEACGLSGVEGILAIDRFEEDLKSLLDGGRFHSVALDLSGYDAHPGDDPVRRFANRIRRDHPQVGIENVHGRLSAMRSVKKPEEIALVRAAVERTGRGIRAIIGACRPGAMEYELAAAFHHSLEREGCLEPAFPSIVATGRNVFYLHYDRPTATLQDGDLVQLDVGASAGGLNADISRVLPVNGHFTARQRGLYELVLQCQQAAFDALRPGVSLKDVNESSRETAFLGLREFGLVESREQVGDYFWHGVSHHLGMDVHDTGTSGAPAAAGMVVTVEPGLYVPEWGIGVRIEDDALVTEDGCVNLSASIPKEIAEIERLMVGGA